MPKVLRAKYIYGWLNKEKYKDKLSYGFLTLYEIFHVDLSLYKTIYKTVCIRLFFFNLVFDKI